MNNKVRQIDNMPSSVDNCIDSIDYNLELPTWSLSSLRSLASLLSLPRPRTLAWAILLQALPTPDQAFITSVNNNRVNYEELKNKYSTDPRNVMGDDPLSQNDESAWNQHFCDMELKALILQDVVRTFPDEMYFRDENVQTIMVNVLFVWSRAHAYIGYRQGMHEVLAPLLYELHVDRQLAPPGVSHLLSFYLEENFLEHDSFMLFSAVMKGLERFYTTGDVKPTSCGRLPATNTKHPPNEVARYLDRVKTEYLIPADPELAAHLAECHISLELFGIRWLRLLFGREFPRSELPLLWGHIFAEGPALPYIHYTLVAMLIAMRDSLLVSAGSALCALMRPCSAAAQHVCRLALHLRAPSVHARPALPAAAVVNHVPQESATWQSPLGSSEGVSEGEWEGVGVGVGDDVARELATLALVRARLPAAAAALARALPKPGAHVATPLTQIMQLASLVQCRNHALIDVETALEAAEGQTTTENIGRRQLLPVTLIGGRRGPDRNVPKLNSNLQRMKEVPLKVFHEAECVLSDSDLPSLDPLKLRTD